MNVLWTPTPAEINAIIHTTGAPDARLRSDTVVRVLSQNTWTHYGDKYAPPNFEERLLSLLDQMYQFDIVLLQELISVRALGVNVASWRYWMINKAKERGFVFYADAKPNFVGIDNGCLILSKFPIVQCFSMDFADSSKYFSIKGAIRATIELVSKKKLDVFCLHLDAHGEEVRNKQLQQLHSYIAESIDPQGLCLIAGDFNVEEHTQEGRHLKQTLQGYTSMVSNWLDYIFVSEELRKKVKQSAIHTFKTSAGQPVSDHNGVSVQLHF